MASVYIVSFVVVGVITKHPRIAKIGLCFPVQLHVHLRQIAGYWLISEHPKYPTVKSIEELDKYCGKNSETWRRHDWNCLVSKLFLREHTFILVPVFIKGADVSKCKQTRSGFKHAALFL